ncbi:MAG: S49 family peptidase [Pseudomonadota bacterium]
MMKTIRRLGPHSSLAAEVHANLYGQVLAIEETHLNAYLTHVFANQEMLAAGPSMVSSSPIVSESGVAVLNISGPLLAREVGFCSPLSYDAIRGSIETALEDPRVNQIVLRMDTPGGHASGAFELAEFIFESRGKKPIVAAVDPLAASAGYLIAASADRVYLGPTGQVGSIGTAWMHESIAGMNEQMGREVTTVYFGAHKVDGNRNFPLSEQARARAQSEVDQLGNEFVAAVARYRGLTPDAVAATEALVYRGQEAINLGLADELADFDTVLENAMPKEQSVTLGTGAPSVSAEADPNQPIAATEPTTEPQQPAAPAAPAAMDAGSVLNAVVQAGFAEQTAVQLVTQEWQLESLTAKLAELTELREHFGSLGLDADSVVAAYLRSPVEGFRMAMSSREEDLDPDISNTPPAPRTEEEIAEERSTAMWDKAQTAESSDSKIWG